MSKYGVTVTELRDDRCLTEALQELGYEVEVHPQGANLEGYEGLERPERANVIIRRRHLNPASNDIRQGAQVLVVGLKLMQLDQWHSFSRRRRGRA